MGLADVDLDRHIACDIGVAGLGAHLAAALDACFIAQVYSRLVIDCNRAPGAEDSIAQVSDGSWIAGNAGLSETERCARIDEIYRPYHDRIGLELDARHAQGAPTILVALHSFTPTLQGVPRPWLFGVLHRGDSRFSASMLSVMSRALGAKVGDNRPYAMDGTDNTVPLHATARDIDYLELEVRQDLIADEAGQRTVCDQLAAFLAEALASPTA
jgi:predicted N-formylglutamate amidohydrolase